MGTIARLSALALLALGAANAAAQELGTLFHTPEERLRLDKLRRGEPVQSAAAEEGPAASRRPAVTGYVQRSDGRNTVWIDGRPVVIAAPNAGRLLEPRIVQPRGEPPAEGVRIERDPKR